jgi:hypothetical protein
MALGHIAAVLEEIPQHFRRKKVGWCHCGHALTRNVGSKTNKKGHISHRNMQLVKAKRCNEEGMIFLTYHKAQNVGRDGGSRVATVAVVTQVLHVAGTTSSSVM